MAPTGIGATTTIITTIADGSVRREPGAAGVRLRPRRYLELAARPGAAADRRILPIFVNTLAIG